MLAFILLLMCNVLLKTVNATSDVDPRIIGGAPIDITDAPYQVSVRLKYRESQRYGTGHICGGSVISQRVVLTAAHCIANVNVNPMTYRSADEYVLVMGDTFLLIKTANTLEFGVQEIVHNPNFNIKTLIWDLALMLIDGSIPNNYPTVKAIALNSVTLKPAEDCLISGWGKINDIDVSNTLMEATVPIVSYNNCDISYNNIPTSMICAGYLATGGVDACQGDSGGPLVCNNKLAGIVSWGFECAKAGYPGVYTNVSYYRGWIESTNQTFNYSYFKGHATAMGPQTSLVGFTILIIVWHQS